MSREINDAMLYIENHLAEELNLDENIPQITGMSLFQFKKIFLLLSGVPLLEYIRKRRMTLACYDLRERNMKVIDVATKYCYNSPDAFTKAFYKVHGVNPSDVFAKNTAIKSYSPITFQLTIMGGSQMNYKIEEKEAFKIVGIKRRLLDFYRDISNSIIDMREALGINIHNKLAELSNVKPYGGYSATYNVLNSENEEKIQCDFMMGTLTTNNNVLDLDCLDVPKATWAVFTSEENKYISLQEVWIKILTEWLPSSEYEIIDNEPIIFFVGDVKRIDEPSVSKEIWIQVKKTRATLS
ncbi:AraC family transcriptional regulator [Amphibacillus marinus]|uniref:AraC family transcriptional regulator n=1 Tax=Amphibacillus marinus TaxID=872970 RepID=A0A1H8H9I1_9BACI|nr:AraC family transcriptional regulator [Amphibacillus marinus]SEN52760.1 AraC family transcriptional regulator [Amphibacillus marinus]